MSEVNKNMYLDFGGLQRYDELIKQFIATQDGVLSDAIAALDAKLGEFASDDKTVADSLEEIKGSIASLIAKDGELAAKDAELESKIAEEIGKIVGVLGEGESHMTLVEIAAQLKSLGDSVSANTENISKITERVAAVEKSIADLGEIEGGENLGTVVGKVNSNAEAIETLKGEEGVLGSVKNTAKSYADAAQSAAEATAAADATSKADAAEAAAKEYADGLVKDADGNVKFDEVGAAAKALEDAQSYVDGKVDGKFDEKGAAAAAQSAAEAYADALVMDGENPRFDAAGSAAAAQEAAEDYADSLATNYDAAGSAAGAQAAAEANAKIYADGLVKDAEGKSLFDAAGDAAAAETAAKAYADEKAGANAQLIDGLSGRIGSLEGIAHAANVTYNAETKFINIVDAQGNAIGAGFDASPFIVDGMLDGVAFEEVEGVKTNNLVFTFNTAAGKEDVVVDFTKYVDIYQGDGSSIELNSETKTFSVKEVDASKTKLSTSIEVNGGPLADDASDNWPWTVDGKKVIPAGKTMEEILTSLFLKVTNGTVSKGSITWNPTLSAPSVSITQSGTVEVGTKLTATANTTNTVSGNSRSCTFTCKPGHFLSTGTDDEGKLVFGSYVSGNKTVTANAVDPATTGEPSIKTYWNGTEVTNVNGTTEYTVSVEGTNIFKVDQSGVKAYAGAFDDITVYGATNTKVPVESVKASIANDTAPAAKDLTSTNKAEVTGARAYWMGAMATPLTEFTSATIREAGEDSDSGLVKTLGASPATTLEVPAGSYDVVIITQKEVTSVISKAQGNFEIGGNFTKNHQEVNVEGANGFTAIKYHVYHCNADWDKDTLTISYK